MCYYVEFSATDEQLQQMAALAIKAATGTMPEPKMIGIMDDADASVVGTFAIYVAQWAGVDIDFRISHVDHLGTYAIAHDAPSFPHRKWSEQWPCALRLVQAVIIDEQITICETRVDHNARITEASWGYSPSHAPAVLTHVRACKTPKKRPPVMGTLAGPVSCDESKIIHSLLVTNGLSDWERSFIESASRKMKTNLSIKERAKIATIAHDKL